MEKRRASVRGKMVRETLAGKGSCKEQKLKADVCPEIHTHSLQMYPG